jgi:hypothetical protein
LHREVISSRSALIQHPSGYELRVRFFLTQLTLRNSPGRDVREDVQAVEHKMKNALGDLAGITGR